MRAKGLLPKGWDLYKLLLVEADNDVAKLIYLADRDSDVLARCLDPSLDSIWEEAWSQMNAKPTFAEYKLNPTLKYRPLKPQPHLGAFFRLAGMYFFHCGGPGQRELLVKAAQAPYYSFHALRALAEEYIAQMHKGQPTSTFALLNARSASNHHHAPGFILLAETYYELGVYFSDKDAVKALESFTEAYKNSVIADYLQPYCVESMYNAYFGLGPKISNGFGLKTTHEIMANLRGFLERNDVMVDFTQAEEQAVAAAKQIVEQFYTTPHEKEPLFKKLRVSDADDESQVKFAI